MRLNDYSSSPTEKLQFTIPASLEHLDRALQIVGSSCRLVSDAPDFQREVVSAFGEAFNLVATHSYAGKPGRAAIALETFADRITVHVTDEGEGVDFHPGAPSLGVFIVRSLMDEVSYSKYPDGRNSLTMTRYLR
jgi:anti-sigma regulatory factor (Ser/Thr protein kinase)